MGVGDGSLSPRRLAGAKRALHGGEAPQLDDVVELPHVGEGVQDELPVRVSLHFRRQASSDVSPQLRGGRAHTHPQRGGQERRMERRMELSVCTDSWRDAPGVAPRAKGVHSRSATTPRGGGGVCWHPHQRSEETEPGGTGTCAARTRCGRVAPSLSHTLSLPLTLGTVS
jgi:hypothetical protein